MDTEYTFSTHRLETYKVNLHPKILGILKWETSKLITPTSLRYFKKPNRSDYPLILENENYAFRNKTLDFKKLQTFLSKENVRAELKLKQLKKMSIFTSRGALATILIGAFHNYNWRMFASKVGSNIYIKMEKDSSISVTSKHHWMFIQHCFAESVKDKPNTNLPFEEDDQFYCLFHAQIGDFDLVYTGEITGVIANADVKNINDINELNQLKFVLTKTMFEQKSPNHWVYRYKHWWAQAYLAKVDDIFVGVKKESEEGGPMMVRETIRHFEVAKLCQAAKWRQERQLGELHGFLKWLETAMSDIDCPYTTCELNFNRNSKRVTFKVHEGKTKYTCLPEDLIDYFKTN